MIRRWLSGVDLVTWLLIAIAALCVLVVVMIATTPKCAPMPQPVPTFEEQQLPTTLGVRS